MIMAQLCITAIHGAFAITRDGIYLFVQKQENGAKWAGPDIALKFEDARYQQVEVRKGKKGDRLVFRFRAESLSSNTKGDVKYCLHVHAHEIDGLLEMLKRPATGSEVPKS